MREHLNKFYDFIDKVGKPNFILIVFIIFVVLVTGLYQTFSIATVSEGQAIVDGIKTYKFILAANNETNSVTIAPKSSKNIAITVSNQSETDLLYGIYYSTTTNSDNMTVGYLHTSKYLPKGTIISKENYVVTIKIDNLSDYDLTIDFGVKYGLETGGELILEDNEYWFKQYPIEANVPNLDNNNLTPVYYDEELSTWRVADTSNKNNEWYDYDNQKWANAVILNSGVTKNVGDEITVTGDKAEIKAMFVWIPRYEYKITGKFGTHADEAEGTDLLPGEIEVNFMLKEQTEATEGYTIHPAFNFDNVAQSGIWISKFETTGTIETPTSLPNLESIRNQSVNAQYETAQIFNSYIKSDTLDIHMTKNSEWSSVAYLSQSKFGKYGNVLYTEKNKEIYQNKSTITGGSNGVPSQDTANKSCLYNDLTDRGNGTGSCGGGASTTGNIYGIYDMIGNSNENVMANYNNETSYSEFLIMPDQKYYDLYLDYDTTKACNNGICYGHGLSETNNWYSDEGLLIQGNYWYYRGGSKINGINSGIFSYNTYDGSANNEHSFRVAITSNK